MILRSYLPLFEIHIEVPTEFFFHGFLYGKAKIGKGSGEAYRLITVGAGVDTYGSH